MRESEASEALITGPTIDLFFEKWLKPISDCKHDCFFYRNYASLTGEVVIIYIKHYFDINTWASLNQELDF
jgi:hypothetical protein